MVNRQSSRSSELGQRPQILPVRQQSDLITELVRERLDTILPAAMREAGLDVWLVLCQEDNPDPLYPTMIPMDNWSPILSMLVMVDEGDRVRRYNLSAVDTKDLYERPYAGQLEEMQWPILVDLLTKRDPRTIGIDIGSVAWAAGGLTHNLYNQLVATLPEPYRGRLVSAEKAAVLWGGTLTDREAVLFERVTEIGQAMIAECYRSGTITPGVTTTDDLVWHYWQHARDLGLDVSFRPYFRLHRDSRQTGFGENVVSPGDVIHCDVGIKYLRLNSDHQHLAYVPRLGETDVPVGLEERFRDTLRLQDIYMDEFRHGLTGNELLQNILRRARAENVPTPRVLFAQSRAFPAPAGAPDRLAVGAGQAAAPRRGPPRIQQRLRHGAEHRGRGAGMEQPIAAAGDRRTRDIHPRGLQNAVSAPNGILRDLGQPVSP